MGEVKGTASTIVLTVVSEDYPKGKLYNLNNCVEKISEEQITLLLNAFGKLVEGTITGYKIRKTTAYDMPANA